MMKRVLVALAIMALFAMPMLAGGPGKAGCCKAAGVERSVTNLDNGVKITITANDPKAIAQVQTKAASCSKESCGDCPMMSDKVTRTVEKTDTGVVITAISTDAAIVKAIQEHAAAEAKGEGCGRMKQGASGCPRGHEHAPATS
jgi:TusA-related sulfurtransferase